MKQTFSAVVNSTFDANTLKGIDREILLIWGDKDTATPLRAGKIMETSIKGAGLSVIENAGHYAFLDKPKTFTAIVRSYLNLPA